MEWFYEIEAVANFIHAGNFRRVALQVPSLSIVLYLFSLFIAYFRLTEQIISIHHTKPSFFKLKDTFLN